MRGVSDVTSNIVRTVMQKVGIYERQIVLEAKTKMVSL